MQVEARAMRQEGAWHTEELNGGPWDWSIANKGHTGMRYGWE